MQKGSDFFSSLWTLASVIPLILSILIDMHGFHNGDFFGGWIFKYTISRAFLCLKYLAYCILIDIYQYVTHMHAYVSTHIYHLDSYDASAP